jgi:cyclohexanone monooxygenase
MSASNTSQPNTVAPLKAIIIGAGFAGIGMAIALRKAGVEDFAILERAPELGGVWHDNCYPGAACDIPSHLYSFSFEPNPGWSRVFSTQAEIQAYLRHCADKYGLQAHIRFSNEVAQAVFDEARSLWHVTLADGTVLSAGMLVSASGMFGRPVMPKIEGIGDFKGRAFHCAQWDHRYALEGKRVAVIGTGASSVQIVPAIAGKVARLSVFQRSAPHMLPRADRAYTRWERAMFVRMPWTTRLYRLGIYLKYESRALAFTRFKWLMKVAVGVPFRRMLARQVPDAALRARLRPDYPIGCKRILLSSDYLATLARPNVELVTEAIRRVTPDGIETAGGVHHRLDAIVFATGFAPTEFLAPMRIAGRRGLLLGDAWKSGAAAYLGMTVPGFPNFFMLYGPNTNGGEIVSNLERQSEYAVRVAKRLQREGVTSVEVKRSWCDAYNNWLQKHMRNTSWTETHTYFVSASGRIVTQWPYGATLYGAMTKLFGRLSETARTLDSAR